MNHPSFLIHFGKRIEDKWYLGVELGKCDRYELKSSQCHFEMSKSMTPN